MRTPDFQCMRTQTHEEKDAIKNLMKIYNLHHTHTQNTVNRARVCVCVCLSVHAQREREANGSIYGVAPLVQKMYNLGKAETSEVGSKYVYTLYDNIVC